MSSKIIYRSLFVLLLLIIIAVVVLIESLIVRIVVGVFGLAFLALAVVFKFNFFHFPRKSVTYEYKPIESDGVVIDDGSFTILRKESKLVGDASETDKTIAIDHSQKYYNINEIYNKIANEPLPSETNQDSQLAFVIEKILTILKESFNAYSVLFFWHLEQKGKVSLNQFVSDAQTELTVRKFDIEDDILGKIIKTRSPQLISELSEVSELDMIRYYASRQRIKSFVGVPFFYGEQLIGILAMDAKQSDLYGMETIHTLGKFVRLITILIKLFEERFNESLARKRLSGLLDLINSSDRFENEQAFIDTIDLVFEKLLDWDAFVFVFFHLSKRKFETIRVVNKRKMKYIGEGLEVELNDTLVGKAIKSWQPSKVDDMSAAPFKRYSSYEDTNYEGSFLAIPIVFNRQNFGAFCFERLKKSAFDKSEINFLLQVTNLLSFVIYSFSNQTLLRSHIAIDLDTQALTKAQFLQRFETDLVRANSLSRPSVLVLLQIDPFGDKDTLFDTENRERIISAIASIIRVKLDHFMLFGRLESDVFGIYFFNTELSDVVIWGNNIRKSVAQHIMDVHAKQTNFTVSMGVVSATGKTEVSGIIDYARKALQKAQVDGNKVVSAV